MLQQPMMEKLKLSSCKECSKGSNNKNKTPRLEN
jgi:hypothetical protein